MLIPEPDQGPGGPDGVCEDAGGGTGTGGTGTGGGTGADAGVGPYSSLNSLWNSANCLKF